MRGSLLASLLLLGSCGGDGGGGGTIDAGGGATIDSGGGATIDGGGRAIDAGGGGTIADPTTAPLADDWLDSEPNDDPAHAVPVGTASADVYTWMGFTSTPPSSIGGADTVDWFVFRSAPTASMFHSYACGETLHVDLYKVMNDQPTIAASSTDTGGCAVIDMFALETGTVYLYKLSSSAAAAGMYSS